MGKGIYHYFGYDYNFERRTQLIAQAGFDSTMLWWGDEDFIPLTKAEQVACIREAGLAIENVHAPYDEIVGLWSKDPKALAHARASYLRYLGECKDLDVSMMVIHGLPQEPIEDEAAGLESFGLLLEAANDLGVTLAVENTIDDPRFTSLLDAYIPQGIKWCYDSSHDWVYGKAPRTLLRTYAHALACLHLSDNDGTYDRHWLPGEGLVDYGEIGRILRESNFAGQWSLEVFPAGITESAEDFLRRARARLEWVMGGASDEYSI
jgi:sugar phosphate isomerase/epimerase